MAMAAGEEALRKMFFREEDGNTGAVEEEDILC
jgi:hypothetical protein